LQSKEDKRKHIINEVIETERAYVSFLSLLVQVRPIIAHPSSLFLPSFFVFVFVLLLFIYYLFIWSFFVFMPFGRPGVARPVTTLERSRTHCLVLLFFLFFFFFFKAYAKPLKELAKAGRGVIDVHSVRSIFSDVETIHFFNSQLLADLSAASASGSPLGDIFLRMVEMNHLAPHTRATPHVRALVRLAQGVVFVVGLCAGHRAEAVHVVHQQLWSRPAGVEEAAGQRDLSCLARGTYLQPQAPQEYFQLPVIALTPPLYAANEGPESGAVEEERSVVAAGDAHPTNTPLHPTAQGSHEKHVHTQHASRSTQHTARNTQHATRA
jgi:hypothetical protein